MKPIDVFMVSYAKDAQWLRWSTATIEKNLAGISRIIVVAPIQDRAVFDAIARERKMVEMRYIADWPGGGYYWQQWVKMRADEYSDAPLIAHMDSDTFIAKPTAIADFFVGKKPAWLWSYYTAFKGDVPWQQPTSRATGMDCPREFMQSFPFILHRSTYAICRRHLEMVSGRTCEQYIRECVPPPGGPPGFSEFNFMGCVAWKEQHGLYHWVDRNAEAWPAAVHKSRHFWSHAPLAECLPEIQQMLDGGEAQHIRVTNMGIWILSNDSHISKWVEQEGRLDHDQYALAQILKHIRPGDTVVDVGAFIGDHTIAYARAVHGIDSGRVIAFEPNPLPFECLKRNMAGLVHVECRNQGLADEPGQMAVVANGNAGASHLAAGAGVEVITLDSLNLERLNFLKIDAEGMELWILRGARETIRRCRPVMYVEINRGALERAGATADEVLSWLQGEGYRVTGVEPGPQFDVFCRPPPDPNRRVVLALGVSDRDVYLARLWLHWVSFLCSQPGGDSHQLKLVVSCTRRVTASQWQDLKASIIPSAGMFELHFATCPDEQEAGYPGSASHLFLRTLEAVGDLDPGAAILWCETDTVALRPGWAQEIIAEYLECGQPFMGDRAGPNDDSHMTGNGVYPPDWRELAPLIVDAARPQAVKYDGHKNGVAWDVHAQSQITPRMHACRTIHQIWRPALFNERNLHQIRDGAALFHQDKTGSLILALARRHYPDFNQERICRRRFFSIEGKSMVLPDGPPDIRFTPCAHVPGLGWIGVRASTNLMEEMLLQTRSKQHKGVSEISEADYLNLMGRRSSLRLPPP